MTGATVLRTRRLVLRELAVDDAAFILRLLNEPSFVHFIGDRGVRSRDDARRYILQGPVASYARFGLGLYLTLLQQGGIAIGICGMLRRDGRSDVEVGFALLPQFWSNGYAYESAAAVLAHARGALGLTRITAPQNLASISVLRKLGLRFEQNVRLEEHGAELELYASSA